MQVQDEIVNACRGAVSKQPADERLAGDGNSGFRANVGQRPESRAEPGGQDEGGVRQLGFLEEHVGHRQTVLLAVFHEEAAV